MTLHQEKHEMMETQITVMDVRLLALSKALILVLA